MSLEPLGLGIMFLDKQGNEEIFKPLEIQINSQWVINGAIGETERGLAPRPVSGPLGGDSLLGVWGVVL